MMQLRISSDNASVLFPLGSVLYPFATLKLHLVTTPCPLGFHAFLIDVASTNFYLGLNILTFNNMISLD